MAKLELYIFFLAAQNIRLLILLIVKDFFLLWCHDIGLYITNEYVCIASQVSDVIDVTIFQIDQRIISSGFQRKLIIIFHSKKSKFELTVPDSFDVRSDVFINGV